ncbi:MAG: hypothetical protein ACFCD0_07395 [Gemmataceae bacterium]
MFTSLVCGLVLSLPAGQDVADKGELKIVNPRASYGRLGATRPKEGAMPGDTFHFSFEIRGMKEDKKGRVAYELTMEIFNAKGEQVFKLGPQNRSAVNFFGGKTMPCLASMTLPLTAEPGPHKLRLTVADRNSKKKAVFETIGKVRALDFGFVRVATYANKELTVPMPPVGVVGQTMTIGFSVIGFERDKETGQPNIDILRGVVHGSGKVISKPAVIGTIKQGIGKDEKLISPSFTITLNNAGKYTVVLMGRDRVSGKSATVRLPIEVIRLKGPMLNKASD